MKILFSHGGIIKLFPIEKGSQKNYENMKKFVRDNLPKVPPNFVVKYKDEEGDLVVIQNNKDIENLFDTKSADYVRASVEDVDAVNADSDISDEESQDSDDRSVQNSRNNILKDEDSRLKSEDQADNEPEDKERQFLGNNSISNGNHKQQEQIFKTQINFKNDSSQKIKKDHVEPSSKQSFSGHHKKTSSEQIYEPVKIKQTQEQRMKEVPNRKESKSDGPKQSAHREFTQTSQRAQQPNPEQRGQKPALGVVSSMLRSSRIGSAFNEKNVSRLVRTLFNQEFEERLTGLIPKLMEKLKKEVRVSFPTLLAEPQLDQPEQQAQEEPQAPEQQKTIHPNPCTGCMKQVIEGIRYKCMQCEQNYCEDCQKVLKHHHNMLKMRFLQVKEQKPEKVVEPRVQFVNKCFYLASLFGGQGRDYTTFVQKFKDLTEKELFEGYYKKNGKKLKKRMGERLIEMTKKLGLYFGEDYLQYNELVLKNPLETFEGLVGYVKECGIGRSSEEQVEEQSFSELSSSMKSTRHSLHSSSNKEKNFRSTEKPTSTPQEQLQQFVFFICTKYQISAKKQAEKLKFVQEYYKRNQRSLSLQGIKKKFCEEMQKSSREEWRVGYRSGRESL